MKTGSISQTVTFHATPHQVFEALMDSTLHSKFSGGEVKIGRKVGDPFTAFDGWVTGKTTELVKDKKIVQTWHPDMENWPTDHDSIVTFRFEAAENGTTTKLRFTHTDIPSEYVEELRKGWEDNYWAPMKKMFAKNN